MEYQTENGNFRNVSVLEDTDLTWIMIRDGMNSAYKILKAIDSKLAAIQSPRLAQLMELANLSSFLGNLISGAIASKSRARSKHKR